MTVVATPSPEVQAYLDALPDDPTDNRRARVRAIRDAIVGALPEGYEEGMQYGMISYFVPHSRYAHGYHCKPTEPVPFASIGSQKKHIGLYLFCVYVDEALQQRFVEAWTAGGRKLDMGKGCVRIKKTQELPLDVIADTIRSVPVETFLARYEAGLPASVKKKRE